MKMGLIAVIAGGVRIFVIILILIPYEKSDLVKIEDTFNEEIQLEETQEIQKN